MVHILLADDHTIVRKGLKQILDEGMTAVSFGEASNAIEALSLIKKQKWNIAIIDLSMPGRSGLDLLKDIKTIHPKLPVLILSMHPEDQYALRVIKAGACGYMTKDSAPEELVNAVQKILLGGKYVSPSVTEKLMELVYEPQKSGNHESLSDREFEVMVAIASGKTVSEIAAKLSLSVKTISTYRTRILGKLQMKTSAELTHYALKNNLV